MRWHEHFRVKSAHRKEQLFLNQKYCNLAAKILVLIEFVDENITLHSRLSIQDSIKILQQY